MFFTTLVVLVLNNKVPYAYFKRRFVGPCSNLNQYIVVDRITQCLIGYLQSSPMVRVVLEYFEIHRAYMSSVIMRE